MSPRVAIVTYALAVKREGLIGIMHNFNIFQTRLTHSNAFLPWTRCVMPQGRHQVQQLSRKVMYPVHRFDVVLLGLTMPVNTQDVDP